MTPNLFSRDKQARFGYLSRTLHPKFYRTLSLASTVLAQKQDETLQSFKTILDSSPIRGNTFKDRLRQILLVGAFKAWKPSSQKSSDFIALRTLFDQDLTPVVLREASKTLFKTFATATTIASRSSSLITLYPSTLQSDITLSSPDSIMCFKYKCDACKKGKYDYCKEYIEHYEERKYCTVEVEKPWGKYLKRCHTCVTIVGAITELQSLVLREPWLLTEGMAGAPEKAAWEVEEKKKGVEEEDATPDGWTKEEREKIRREAEEAMMKRWGLLAIDEDAGEKEAK